MRNQPVVYMALLVGIGCDSGSSDPVSTSEPDRIELETVLLSPDVITDATPILLEAYGEQQFQSEIGPLLATSRALEAVRRVEEDLLETNNLRQISYLAYALASLGRPESKRALLKKLGGARGGPRRGGVVFGGDSERAHYALISSVAKLEGWTSEGGDHFAALMEWWLNYPIDGFEE